MEFLTEESQSLLEQLSALFPDSSKTTLRGWIEGGRIEVEGKRAQKASMLLRPGQRILVGPRAKVAFADLKIVYEDRDLVVVDKPEGLLSVATDDDDSARSAHSILKRRFHRPRIYPVHRLDRDTSGLLVFAYTEAARLGLKEQFEAHTIDREYRAWVHGIPPEKKGTFESYLQEDAFFYVRSTPTQQGKLAITHYEVIEEGKEISLLRLKLETGRKNQIRVHLSEAGFPIVGDQKYGLPDEKISRLHLHAVELGFVHPANQKHLHFHSACPF